MPPRLRQVPEIHEEIDQYADLNPVWELCKADPRVREQFNKLFFKNANPDNEMLEHNEIARRIEMLRDAIRAKV